MDKVLHIVNSSTVINIMKQAKLEGDFLAWDDFLHEGPVPEGFSLQQLSKIRAYFMNNQGYAQLDKASEKFEARNKIIETYSNYDSIILWFEQDLYDQLQLLEVLNWFEKQPIKKTSLALISTDKHFGDHSFQELHQLILYQKPISDKELKLAKKSWNAFCNPTPIALFSLIKEPISTLPFLKSSIKRLVEEYPNTLNGLSRTAYQALLTISHGKNEPRDIFLTSQKYEEHQFMADVIFWKILNDFKIYKLITSSPDNKELTITPLGQDVLNGKKNWIAIKNIEQWIGGVHITRDNLWCWDIKNKTLKNYYYSSSLSTLLPVKTKKRVNLSHQ